MKGKLLLILLLAPWISYSGMPHSPHSVLASGTWYKVAVLQSGLYRITYEDFVKMGMDPSQIDPDDIRVFGNGGGMLPESNNGSRTDDLRENSIMVVGGEDGHFDPGDYVVFYGESPDTWSFDNFRKIFTHTKNLYSDTTYYYINIDLGPGNRVVPVASSDSMPSYTSHWFLDHAFHELDSVNLIKSGKLWYGEVFDDNRNSYDFTFNFPHADSNSAIYITTAVAADAPVKSNFYLSSGNTVLDTLTVDLVDPSSLNIAAREKKKNSLLFSPHDQDTLNLHYILPTATSLGWLNYIELNCQRRLEFVGPQMDFSDPNNIAPHKISEFDIQKVNPSVRVWDITHKDRIQQMDPLSFDSVFKFRIVTDSLHEFIAFDGSGYFPVILEGPVANQDLHSRQPADLIIITHPLFLSEANRLADFHRTYNNLTVDVATTTEIFNEFSSGMHDPTAIRDYVKMLYDRGSSGNEPRYLLLFGDGSFDPKDRIPNNLNMIPTFQSAGSLNTLASWVSDDYFGIMGDTEGADANGSIEIGMGRFPVTTLDDATIMVDKIIHYSDTTGQIRGDWRNLFTFVADDENSNLHLHQAESLVSIVQSKYPVYNIQKIYLDAYKMVNTPAGMRLPDVNVAIDNAVNKGTLILNYTGHGGENGWAAEKVLTIDDINEWYNANMLPVFITATCEFSRFDNPERFTAGEMILLRKEGGAIALYSTTRAAFASSNIRLDTSFFNHLINTTGGPNPTMGDLLRISKNNNGNNTNIRNFALLGDPAQNINFPEFRVSTTGIVQDGVESLPDTVNGLSTVTVKGEVQDASGTRLNQFNGTVFTKVFDKPVTYTTIGNTSDSYPEDFQMQNKLLSYGKATVKNGTFAYTFIMPQGVTLNYGNGKISYYSKNESTDANGYSTDIIIGGENPDVDPVNAGPDIRLYMDNLNFKPGDITGRNPHMLAFLSDTNGINSLGLGIGHEILATLDGNTASPYVLNDYYVPDQDSYSSGSIDYSFQDLDIGRHTLRLKAWDLFNNSSEKEISFFVFEHPEMSLQQVYNAPNPVRTGTTFFYQAIPGAGRLDILIQIYSFTGQLVKTIQTTQDEAPGTTGEIYWNGTGDGGQMLGSGLYVYRFLAKGDNGAVSQTSQKLMILR